MAEDALIRRKNLARLCTTRGWGAKDLVTHAGRRYSYWRDLLVDPSKSFGERIARNIEQELDLPRLWLDSPQELPVPPELRTGEQPARYVTPHWPFSSELFHRIAGLTQAEMHRLELVMRAHLGM